MKKLHLVILLAFSSTPTYGSTIRAWIAMSPGYEGEGSELVVSWDATPGKHYSVEATTDLRGPWNQLNGEPIVAQSDAETYVDQTTSPIKFYRVRKLDTESPEVAYINPWEGAIAVGRQETVTAHLTDETGVDVDSIRFSIGSGPAVGVDDPRLSYLDGVVTYTPGAEEYLGEHAETVTVSLSVSDTLGYRLEDYTWSFKLELEPILAGNVLIIDDSSPLTLLSAEGDTYTFSYAGDLAGVSVGDILASTDPENPYKARVLTVTDHPESHTVDLLTETVPLAELFEQGSLREKYIAGEETTKASMLGGSSPTPLIGARIPLDGLIIYQDNIITVEVTSGFIEFIPDLTVGVEFGWFELKSFDAEAKGTLNFNATVRATAGRAMTYEYEKNLKTFTKSFFTMVGVIPVLVDVVLEFNIGFTAEAHAGGWVEAGFRSSKSLTLGAKWRDGDDGKWSMIRKESGYFEPVRPTWQIEGGVNLQPYVEAKLIVYLQKLGGPSLNLKPYVELDGYFQVNPWAYEWGLYAGLTSDLAIELRGWDDDWGELPSWRLLDLRWTLLEETYPTGWVRPVVWSRTFGGPATEQGWSVQQTSDGGYIVAGDTGAWPLYDVYVIKVDSQGHEQWIKTFGGNNGDSAWSVQQTSDGGYIIGGWTKSFGAGEEAFYLIKTDAEGNKEWSKTFGGSDRDIAYSVQQTSDGGYIVAGWTESFGTVGRRGYLVKTDRDGNELWSKTFGGNAYVWAESVQQTLDGGYIVAGYTSSSGGDMYLLKTDESGNEQWSRSLGGGDMDFAYSARPTSDGGYIVVGYTSSFGAGANDVFLVKTDHNGNQQWSKTFGDSNTDEGYSVQQTSDGGYIVGGYTLSFGTQVGAVYLVKTDRNGREQWSRIVGGELGGTAYSVQQTSDGGYIVAGTRWGDVYLIKTDESGYAPLPE